uniref:Ring-cleaving dioxygenase n=1 Tax=Roseihalotalea indica TaxID=2867963 RepID=A0AA49GMF9_9BACT|nr:ring-cleaving dioxygenase [Tunicatimonas sp. TK19036]
MEHKIKGIHHVTAIAGNARRNLDFYTRVLGLRLVKRTVNFDDPGTYHFYFGNETGDPGTILTFFPWEGIIAGKRGTGQATETAFSVPASSLNFWQERLDAENVIYNKPSRRLDEEYLTLVDPDGLKLELVATQGDTRTPYTGNGIDELFAIRGFYNVTLSVEGYEKTARLLTEVFGYSLIREEVNRFRFATGANEGASIIDLVCLPAGQGGQVAGGSVHHVAFRARNDEEQWYFRDQLAELGYNVTPPINRDYFMSVYFREPSGVLFEIATDSPGFTVDEPLDSLGTALKLPKMYEPRREEIENILPPLN